MNQNEFKYKLDFYYQQSLLYLVTLILYAGVKGTFIDENFTVVFRDPILYIIAFFVLQSFTVLILNVVRGRKLIIDENKIIFHNKFKEKEVLLNNIEWMYIGKEKSVQTNGRFQVVVMKVKDRRRLYRIRLGRYERPKELLTFMQEISNKVPKKKKRWSR